MFKAAEQYVAVSLLALFLGGCLYQNQKERIDPYIQPLFNPQHADVVYAVNCGGPKLLGTNDVLYLSDESIPQATGGNAASLKVLVKGAKTADLNLYQTERWCEQPCSYKFDTPYSGKYTLVLKFSENVDHHKKGSRVFSVRMGGATVAKDLDIVAATGSTKKVHDVFVEFEVAGGELKVAGKTYPITGPQIDVALQKGPAENPKINAIVVTRGNKAAAAKVFAAKKKGKKAKAKMSDVWELDVLVFTMFALTLAHAVLNNQLLLAATFLVLSLFTEQASIRLGGTHCHDTSPFMVSRCSSLNSVLYYVPWMYSCFLSGVAVAGQYKWLTPWIVGWLHFGFCGPYEMQGPVMKWWKYPNKQGYIFKGDASDTWFLLPDKEGIKAAPHAVAALAARWHSMPVYATLFHYALGFGFATGMYFTGGNKILSAVLTPLLGLAWTLPVNGLEAAGVPHLTSVPFLMLLAALGPALLWAMRWSPKPAAADDAADAPEAGGKGKGQGKKGKGKGAEDKPKRLDGADEAEPEPATTKADPLLFLIPLMNVVYFTTVHFRYAGIKTELYLVVTLVSLFSLVVHAYGCGMFKYEQVKRVYHDGFSGPGHLFEKLATAAGNAHVADDSSPVGLVALVLMILAALYGVARMTDISTGNKDKFFVKLAASVVGAHWAGWGVSYGYRLDWFVTKVGLVATMASVVYIANAQSINFDHPHCLIVGFAVLGDTYIRYWNDDAKTAACGGNDPRFVNTKHHWAAYLVAWTVGAANVVVGYLPVFAMLYTREKKDLDSFSSEDMYAVYALLAGLVLKYIVDQQGLDFYHRYETDEGATTDHALVWRLSRHPDALLNAAIWGCLYFLMQGPAYKGKLLPLCVGAALYSVACALCSTLAFVEKDDDKFCEQEVRLKRKQDTPFLINQYVEMAGLVAVIAIVAGAVHA